MDMLADVSFEVPSNSCTNRVLRISHASEFTWMVVVVGSSSSSSSSSSKISTKLFLNIGHCFIYNYNGAMKLLIQ
ncbi:hypothetical protein EB796_018861 [Bugula neritina]|uniref:Uncharacterized protein n=1 Tax=Bugula neritina TaxID=10212 RepID=A0A7J7J9X8_BUGNE|nr:hypothetical protein EB796_018861 [Bugula neritina]